MASMPSPLDPVSRVVVGGVDTHKDLHVAAVVAGWTARSSIATVSMWGPGVPGLPDPHSDGRAKIRGAGTLPSFLTRTSD